MSTLVAPAELVELLGHYGIKAPVGRVEGGQIADIYGFVDRGGAKAIAIAHGAKRVERACPLDEKTVAAMVEEVFGSTAYRDASFERLIAHLLERASHLYESVGIDSFRLESIHLHPTGYDIARALAFRTGTLHLGRPKEKREIVFHSSFPHDPNRR
ncbi:MAG TPA: hypothetical protein VIG46_02360 [Candidatus Baltobacteraceae bacterium]|jgi:hypothetical protein